MPIETARLRIYRTSNSLIAEVQGRAILVASAVDALELWFRARAERADWMALHEANISPEFFDLRSGLAGEVLQKLVNYRARLAIVGDIARYLERSESLKALVRESNRGKDVRFAISLEALLGDAGPAAEF